MTVAEDYALMTVQVRAAATAYWISLPGFDRWLAEVRREAAEKAWREGALAAGGHHEVLLRCPYRKKETT